jgi:ATP-binding cassette subfamily C protein LapB
LLVGLPDPGDQVLHDALKRSGLIRLVASHPRGLELPIFEGGKGLSGGQRQLVAFTRLLLAQPTICLLDEPTASMDEEQERRCLGVLTELLTLPLVQRLVVVAGGSIVLDGPRDEVLARLQRNALAGATAAATPQAARAEPLPAENRADNHADNGRGQRLEPTTS